MRQALFGLGIVGVGIPLYDQVALSVNESSSTQSLPFIWQGALANAIPELWIALLGIAFILIAIFIPGV